VRKCVSDSIIQMGRRRFKMESIILERCMITPELCMKKILRCSAPLVAFAIVLTALTTPARADRIVYLIPIKGTINSRVARFVGRAIDDAEEAKANAVILEINTFGGQLDAATKTRDSVLDSKILTIAFVNKRAISAGTLISLAAKKIVMAPGATIGAATPVDFLGRKASEKVMSYWRKEVKSTAEKNNRPTRIAEAMVDEEVEIPELVEKGKLLTLTTNEALECKIADYEAESIDEVLKAFDLAGAQVVSVSTNASKQLLRPWILWVALAAACIVIEIFTAGFFVFWFGVGAGVAAILAAVGLPTAWQWGSFIVVSAVCLVLSRRFAERITKGQKRKVGPDRLIDKVGVVLEKINPDTGEGKVRVESEEWRAISANGEVIDAGSHVYVVKIEGTHLIVKRRER
jgi:membrane-bound ClpP family serine protease